MPIGHCLALTELERLDVRLPTRGKIRLSDVVKSYLGLLTLGESDFEPIRHTARIGSSRMPRSLVTCRAACGCGSSGRGIRWYCESIRMSGVCG